MKHVKLFEQFLNEGFINESKKFPDAFAVLDFFGGALPNDYNKAHAAAKRAGYDLPTSLYDEAAHMAQDGENENLHENINDVITIKDVDIDFTLGGTTDLKQQIAKDEKKFKIKVKPTGKSYNVATFAYDLIGKKKDLLNFLQNDEGMGWDDEETKEFYPELYEGRIALNHVYANAPVRNKILEILRNGRVAEQDFMDAVSKAGAPTKWISRNSHFFKVEEEDGVKYYSLTKSGHVIMSALNESEVLEIYEEFGLEENLIVDPLDLTKDFFYVSINGKVYGYQAKPGGNIEDVATTFKKMLKYSAGKALAWLKKNTELALGAGGSGPLREDESINEKAIVAKKKFPADEYEAGEDTFEWLMDTLDSLEDIEISDDEEEQVRQATPEEVASFISGLLSKHEIETKSLGRQIEIIVKSK